MAGIVVQKDNVHLLLSETSTFAASDKIGNITSIGDISVEAEDVETTTIESLAKEFENGMADNGTIEVTQNVTSTEYAEAKAKQYSGAEYHFGIAVWGKTGTQLLSLSGRCIVKSCSLSGIEVGGLLQCTMSLRLNGDIDVNSFVDPVGYTSAKKVTGINLTTVTGENTVPAGGSLQLIAAITPSDASNKGITWSVSHAEHFSISPSGLLSADSEATGSVTVTATAKDGSNVTGSKAITVG